MDNNGGAVERAAKLFCFAFYALGAYLVCKYMLGALMPVLAAFFISWCVWRVSGRLHGLTGIGRGAWAFVIVTLGLGGLAVTVFLLARELFLQVSGLVRILSRDGLACMEPIFSVFERVPVLQELAGASEDYTENKLAPLLSKILGSVSGALGTLASGVIKTAPGAVLSAVVFVMCVYYMSMDFGRISNFALCLLPKSFEDRVRSITQSTVKVAGAYLKSYAKLFLLTFCEVLAGLLLLCPKYALVMALAIAAVDIFPVLGAGLVLLPWGLILIASGDVFRGVGLIVLYVAVTVVRQIAEPRIVGAGMGLHPLGACLAMYVGHRLFGTAGMLLSPVVAAVAVNVMGNKS